MIHSYCDLNVSSYRLVVASLALALYIQVARANPRHSRNANEERQHTNHRLQLISHHSPVTDDDSTLQNKFIPQLYNDQLDAPKYYDLNGLAYKEATAKKSPFGGASELKPLDGSRALRPKAAAGGSLGVGKEDEESSIDSLIKAMRSGAGSPKDSGAGVTYEDQGSSIGRKKSFATMMDSVALDELEENAQRKSNIADEDLEVDPNSSRTSARLRSKGK